jgi:DNA-directed RNA polymerase subunit RPC12/RpoP
MKMKTTKENRHETYICFDCKHISNHFYGTDKIEHCTPCGSKNIKVIKWFSVSDVEQLQKQNVSDTQRLLSEIQKELKDKLHFTADKVEHYKDANDERIIGIYALFFEYNKELDEVFNNFKGK